MVQSATNDERQGDTSTPTSARQSSGLPVPLRWAVISSAGFGVVGGIVGLVVGLFAYPPTAWFAVFELGVPAAFVGTWIGLFAGTIALIGNRLHRKTRARPG